MKKDKICINKTLTYLVLLVLVVAGFLWVMDRANQANKATKSEAAVRKAPLGGVLLTPPMAPVFTLTELKQRADAVIVKLTAGIGRTATLNTSDLQKSLDSVKSAKDAAQISYNNTNGRLMILMNLITSSQNTTNGDITIDNRVVTAAQQAVDTAQARVNNLKIDEAKQALLLNTANTNLQIAQNTLTTAGNRMNTTKTALKNNIKGLDNAFNIVNITDPALSIFIRNIEKSLNNAKPILDKATITVTDINSLKVIASELNSNSAIKLIGLYPSWRSLFNTYGSLVSDLETNNNLLTNAQNSFNSANSQVTSAKQTYDLTVSTYNQASQDLSAKKTVLTNAENTLSVHQVVKQILDSKKTELDALNQSFSEGNPLPNTVALVVSPATTYGVNVSELDMLNTSITNFNTALQNTYSSYTSLDSAITSAGQGLTTQVQAYTRYCSNIKTGDPSVKLYSIMDDNGLPADWAQMYYETYCAKDVANYQWNGLWGNKAMCYTATGLCVTNSLCHDKNCIVGINNKISCIYRDVDVNNCQTKYAQYGVDILQAGFTCPPANEGMVYDKLGANYYQKLGSVYTDSVSNRMGCMNKKLTSASEIQAAQDWLQAKVNAKVVAKNSTCQANIKFAWKGAATFKVLTDPNTYINGALVPTGKPVMTKYDTCLQLGGVSDKVGSSCVNLEVADYYCQCKDFGYTKYINGMLYNSTNTPCRLIPTP